MTSNMGKLVKAIPVEKQNSARVEKSAAKQDKKMRTNHHSKQV